MAVPNMSDERYKKLTHREKVAYWLVVLGAVGLVGFVIFFWR
jgi:hypothetical protein